MRRRRLACAKSNTERCRVRGHHHHHQLCHQARTQARQENQQAEAASVDQRQRPSIALGGDFGARQFVDEESSCSFACSLSIIPFFLSPFFLPSFLPQPLNSCWWRRCQVAGASARGSWQQQPQQHNLLNLSPISTFLSFFLSFFWQCCDDMFARIARHGDHDGAARTTAATTRHVQAEEGLVGWLVGCVHCVCVCCTGEQLPAAAAAAEQYYLSHAAETP